MDENNNSNTISRPELSVVVLGYRSEEKIIPFIAQMEKELRDANFLNYELVLVGNYNKGSDDKTPEVVRQLAKSNPRIVAVTREKEGMMGWDTLTGFTKASGEVIAWIDGDGQMPSKDIVRLFRILKSGEFDFVKTFRSKRLDGSYRRIVSVFYNFAFHVLFPGSYFRDINSKPKIITKEAYEKMKLTCTGWFLDGEMMMEVRRLHLLVAEIPTVFHENEWRASFVKLATVFEMFASLLYYRFVYWFRRK